MSVMTLSVTSMRAPDVHLHNGGRARPELRDPALLITLARAPIGFLGVALLLAGQPLLAYPLLVVFALVDFIDGHVARLRGTETGLRRVIDVVIDRLAIAGALLVLAFTGELSLWMVSLFVARDIAQGIVSGTFTARHRTVLIGPRWHMSYGLSMLTLVLTRGVDPAFADPVVAAAVLISTLCLADFARRVAALSQVGARNAAHRAQ